MNKRMKNSVWVLLAIASLSIVILSILQIDQWNIAISSILISIAFSAWLGVNHIYLGTQNTLTFTHSLGLFLGLTLGPFPAIFSLSIGLLIATLIDRARDNCVGWAHCTIRSISISSRQIISLAGGLGIYRLLGGDILSGIPALPATFPTIALSITFSILFLSLYSVERWLHNSARMTRRESTLVSLIALLPIPIVLIGAIAYSVFSETALIIYGAMLAFAAPTFRVLLELQDDLVRKSRSLEALFELATSRDLSLGGHRYYALVDLALAELGIVDFAALFLADPGYDQLHLVHTFRLPNEKSNQIQDLVNLEIATSVFQKKTSEQINIEELSHAPDQIQQLFLNLGIQHISILSLTVEDVVIGQIWLFFKQEPKPSVGEINQLQVFSDQLAQSLKLSREFATTNAELKRRVEQLARLESIGRQVTSSIAKEDVYTAIIYHGLQATSATHGHLEILNPDLGKLETVAIDTKEGNVVDEKLQPSYVVNRIAQRAFDTGQVTNVPDTQSDPEFGTTDLDSQSLLITPIISQGETIGIIALEKTETGGFSNEEEAFIIQLASQAANALRNAAMYDELQERLKEQSLLYQASAQIAESLDTETIALALADSLAFAVSADATFVYRYNPRNASLYFVVGVEGKNTLEGSKHHRPLEMQIPGVQACIENRRPIQWTSKDSPTQIDGAHLESRGGGTVLLIPLIVGERTLGLVELIRNQDELFEEEELRTVQSIAIQASIILENSDLFQQISQSNNRLSAVLNSTREGMLMIDKDGEIAVVNTQLEELIGADHELLAHTPLQSLDEDFLHRLGYRKPEAKDLVSSLQSGKGHLPGVSTFELPAAERQILRRLETPVHDAHGKLIGWLIVIRDVSEEMQLEESRKHLTEMIVHDLRSPLSAILNSMELLRMQLEGQEQTAILQQALAIADRSVHQMLGLVNALLDLSKLESGQFILTSVEVDFHELIPHLIDTFLPEAEQAGVILDYKLDPSLPKMMLDEEKIFRVLSNLLDNALKFTPAGGKVELGIKDHDDNLLIDVLDTGPGIPEEYREEIFDLYAQVPGTKGRRRGTGLGLAFCKLAVEAHEGEIWVEDNPEGGSRFRVRLPVDK